MTGRVQGIANLTSNSVFKLCRLNKWAVLLMSLIQFSFQLRRPPNLLRRSADRLLQFHCSFALSNFLHTCVMQLNRLSPCYQVATDKCIMLFLFLIVCGVIAIIVVKVSCSSHIWVRWIWCGYFSQLSSNTTFLKLKPMCSNNLFERSIFTWNILNNLLLQHYTTLKRSGENLYCMMFRTSDCLLKCTCAQTDVHICAMLTLCFYLKLTSNIFFFCRLWIPTTKISRISQDWRLQSPQGDFCTYGLENILDNAYIWTVAFSILVLSTWFLFLSMEILEDCCLEASFWSLQLILFLF